MVKKKSRTQYQRQIAELKKKKAKALKTKKELTARGREMQEIRELERDIASLKGVGSKRRIAKEVGMRLGKDAGKVGWKGLKFVGRVAKNIIEAEAREQARDREQEASKPKSRPRVRAKVKTRKKVRSKPKTRKRVRAKVKNGRRR